MKNVHLIATDKPSRLRMGNNGNFVFGIMKSSIQSKNDDFTNQNIYITDNSEIQQGDWFITTDTNQIHKSDWVKFDFNNGKKIIMTTDQDLIADGIQAIDDEFLEWFVKNSSCEFVEVINSLVRINAFDWKTDYKIIILSNEIWKDNTSTYVGVSWSKNAKKWISQITIEGKTKYLGLFDNEEDANKKYLEILKNL